MDPETQQLLAMLQMLMGGGGGMGMDMGGYSGNGGEFGMDPYMGEMLMQGMAPSLDKQGGYMPDDLATQAKRLNLTQDMYSSFADNMNAVMSGPASFGMSPLGGGITGGGGLDPIRTETLLETPEQNKINFLAQQADMAEQSGMPISLEGLVARGMRDQIGVSGIMAQLQAMVESGSDEAELLRASLPQTPLKQNGVETGEMTVDWNGALSRVQALSDPYVGETANLQAGLMGGSLGQNNMGQFVQYAETPSPTMEWLQKLGLPDPRQQYGIDYALSSSPEMAALAGDIAVKGQEFEQAQAAYKKFLDKNPIAKLMENASKERELARVREGVSNYTNDLAAWQRDNPQGEVAPEAEPIQRKESYEEGPPDWLSGLGGKIGGAITDLPDTLMGSLRGAHPRPIRSTDVQRGQNRRETERPQFEMPERSSMVEMLLGGNVRARPDNERFALAGNMNRAARSQGDDILSFVRQIAPQYNAQQAGRTPFRDAMMSRMGPLMMSRLNRA